MNTKKDSNKMRAAMAMLVFVFILIPFLFIDVSSTVLQRYVETGNWVGHVIYIVLLVVSVVAAPFTMPLFLVSGGILGPQIAAVYNIIGWSIGAVIAFLIARYFNKNILSNFVLLEKIKKYEQKISPDSEFLSLVLLRMILPVDILSYMLGFFSNISFIRYVLSTIIGITPFAVIFAYGGDALFSGKYIVLLALMLLVFIAFGIGMHILNKK